MKRNYSNFIPKNFENDLINQNIIQKLHEHDDVNSVYNIFQDHLEETMGKHAPIQYLSNKEIKLKMNPWLTNGLLKSIRTKYDKKFMKTKDKKHYAKYKIYRDKINHLIRASKNLYYKNYFTQYKKNSKKIWDGINNILITKQKSTNSKINIIENNTFITDQLEVANKFNIFFTNTGPLLSDNIADLGHNFSEYLPLPNKNSFFISPTNLTK